jgi:hypothetical protein
MGTFHDDHGPVSSCTSFHPVAALGNLLWAALYAQLGVESFTYTAPFHRDTDWMPFITWDGTGDSCVVLIVHKANDQTYYLDVAFHGRDNVQHFFRWNGWGSMQDARFRRSSGAGDQAFPYAPEDTLSMSDLVALIVRTVTTS